MGSVDRHKKLNRYYEQEPNYEERNVDGIQEQVQNDKTEEDSDEEFDKDRIPPKFEFAKDHQKARRVGISKKNVNGKVNICDCCGYQVDKDQFSLFCDNIDFGIIGAGYTLYFEFKKYCILMLLIIFFISGIYGLHTNSNGNFCEQQLVNINKIQHYYEYGHLRTFQQYSIKDIIKVVGHNLNDSCAQNWTITYSIANKLNNIEQMNTQDMLNFISLIIIIFFLQYVRYQMRYLDHIIDHKSITAQDYSLIVKHIPCKINNVDYDDVLKKLFVKKAIPGQKCQVQKITLCYDLEHYYLIRYHLELAVQHKQFCLARLQKHGHFPAGVTQGSIEAEIRKWDNEFDLLQEDMLQGTSQYFCGIAMISFSTEEERNIVLQNNQISWMNRLKQACNIQIDLSDANLVIGGKQLVLEEAPAPNDINWQNQYVKTSLKLVLRTISNSFTILYVLICGLIIFKFQHYQFGWL